MEGEFASFDPPLRCMIPNRPNVPSSPMKRTRVAICRLILLGNIEEAREFG